MCVQRDNLVAAHSMLNDLLWKSRLLNCIIQVCFFSPIHTLHIQGCALQSSPMAYQERKRSKASCTSSFKASYNSAGPCRADLPIPMDIACWPVWRTAPKLDQASWRVLKLLQAMGLTNEQWDGFVWGPHGHHSHFTNVAPHETIFRKC